MRINQIENEKIQAMFEELSHEFWTRKEELTEDVEAFGFEVLDINDECIVISNEDDEEFVIDLEAVYVNETLSTICFA